jgi:predicted ABC-type ATPase
VIEPQFLIVAGVNGAGKSTLTASRPDDLSLGPVLDPDVVARVLNPANYQGSAVEAGKQVLAEANECLRQMRSFAVETTLSGHTYLRMLQNAKARGFRTHLVYVGLANAELSIERVRIRVRLGGHDVPEQDIRRRYERSLANLKTALLLVDSASLFDNSDAIGYKLVAIANHGEITWLAPAPGWAKLLAVLNV